MRSTVAQSQEKNYMEDTFSGAEMKNGRQPAIRPSRLNTNLIF